MLLFMIVPVIIALIGLAISAAFVYGVVRSRNRIKLIEGAPLCKADQLITGMAKMRGKIMAVNEEDLLVSPLTRTTCVYYKFVVEERRTRTVSTGRGMRTETYWHPVITDIQAVPCTVRDKTGEAFIDLTEPEIVLSKGQQTNSGTFNSASPALERRLNKMYGFSSKGLIFNKALRYTEMVIEEGVKVFVVGEVRVRNNGRATFRKSEHPLLVTDKNEEELVSHYRRRVIGFTIGAVLVPLLFLGCSGIFGAVFWAQSKAMDLAGKNQPGPAQDPLTQKLNEMKDPKDKWVRVRAADALPQMPVQAARRDEVAQQIDVLLNDADKDVRGAAIRAAKVWGTKRHNEASLRRLAAGQDFFEKGEANDALTKLAP